MNVTDFASIEDEKENIMPIRSGRSAQKLAEITAMDKTSLQRKLNEERRHFEKTLEQRELILQLDDPIEPYIDYIKWIRANYTTGNINESGLIKVLERTTHDFKEDDYYRNEVRYFKVWLEYIAFSDIPGEVYKYLYKKKIGTELSLFYERYAQFYELNDQWENAEVLLKEGIQCKARPIFKLNYYFQKFLERKRIKISKKDLVSSKAGLTNRTGTGLATNENLVTNSGERKDKLKVFLDSDAQQNGETKEYGLKHLDNIENAKKENKLNSSVWSGQILKQEIKTHGKHPKLKVFEDSRRNFPITTTCFDKERNRTEIFDFNLDMFLNKASKNGPRTMIDVMLSYYKKFKPAIDKTSLYDNNSNKRCIDNDCITPDHKKIKLHDDFQHETRLIRTPTVTLTTVQARQELMEIFDNAMESDTNDLCDQKDYDALSDDGLSDFVTETITKSLSLRESNTEKAQIIKASKIQPEKQLLSSPFVENPSINIKDKKIMESCLIVDPFDPHLSRELLSAINFAGFPNFHISNTVINKLPTFKSLFKPNAPSIQGNKQSLIEFKPGELHCITKQIGSGTGSAVYLSEKYNGTKAAVKIESPPSQWEAYILNKVNAHASNNFIELKEFYYFNDESYLILPYIPHGSISNLINLLNDQTILKPVKYGDEHLAIYLSIQLLKKMLELHSMEIIHAKIEPKSCLLDFSKSSTKLSFDEVTFINFGKSIDLTLFPSDVKFKSVSTKNSGAGYDLLGEDFWKYEIDYYGLANVVHIILFGKAIRVAKNDHGSLELIEKIKKYWQVELWLEVFELLLNSRFYQPLLKSKFEALIKRLESWFNLTVDRKKFLQKLHDIEDVLIAKPKEQRNIHD